jgi:hypothetical protein
VYKEFLAAAISLEKVGGIGVGESAMKKFDGRGSAG